MESKRVEASFTTPGISLYCRLLLVKDIERRTDIVKAIVLCTADTRYQSYVDHTLENIAAQRVYQIVDANDCNSLCNNSVIKMNVAR